MRKVLFFLGLMILVVLVGCSRDDSSTTGSATAGLEKDLILDGDYTLVEGEFGTGSMYHLYCPDNWNGDLVVYSHGYAMPGEDPALPEIDPLRDALMDRGYGVAYSSYSEVGWAVHVAMNESRQLRGLFSGAFHHPDQTYLMGNSMGGLISVALAERNANLYDGVVPYCGAIGGGRMALDYVYTVRTLFDYYYPGVLPGDAQNVPEDLDYLTAQGLAYMAMTADPSGAMAMAGVMPLNMQFADAGELVQSVLWGITFQVASCRDMLERTHGHHFFDNSDVWYSNSPDDTALNEGVDRFTATADAEAFMRNWYLPTGKLKIPAVTLHTTRDPVVQIFHEDSYAAAVEAAGYTENLRQYAIDRFGHCYFTVEEIMAAFDEMLEMGEGPGGKDIKR
jgi:pimeloyl-ACP methyl ester carboxylesterase